MKLMETDKNGCSACQPGKEQYEAYTMKVRGESRRMYQYDYRTEGGELFACCSQTLEECREKRDAWLKELSK